MTDYDESDFDPDDLNSFTKTIDNLKNNDNILIDLVTSQGLAINDLSSKFEQYKSESKIIIEAKNKQIDELTSRILQLETKQSSTASFSNIYDSKYKRTTNHSKQLTEPELNTINIASEEASDRKSRENNIMIFGVKELKDGDDLARQEDAKKQVNGIFDKINVSKEQILSIYRFNRQKEKENYTSIIKVKLKPESKKFSIMKAAKSLHNRDMPEKIYINLDLTPAQRFAQKKLIEERNNRNESLSKSEIAGDRNKICVIRNGSTKIIEKVRNESNIIQ